MATNNSRAVNRAIQICNSAGFNTSHPEWKGNVVIEAIVTAVLEEVTIHAETTTVVSGGGSYGGDPAAPGTIA